jgi:hypothetical protein
MFAKLSAKKESSDDCHTIEKVKSKRTVEGSLLQKDKDFNSVTGLL